MDTKNKALFTGIVICAVLTLVYLAAHIVPVHAETPPDEKTESFGPSWNTECENGMCTTSIYSYEKYWKEDDEWEAIDESFFDCTLDGDAVGRRYCTNEYYYKVEATEDGTVTVSYKGDSYTMKLVQLSDKQLSFSPELDDGLLVYTVIPDEVELRYQYLPDHLKEEVIIYESDESFEENGLHLSFETTGNVDPLLAPAFVCDSNKTCMDLPHSKDENNIDIDIPAKFFEQDLVYPLIVDPTVTFDATYASWNGYIRNETNQSGAGTSNFTRFSNPASLITVGIGGAMPDDVTRYHHGVIEWNMSSIADNSVIYNATLQLRVESAGFGSPTYSISLFALSHDHDYYADEAPNCQGNCQFYGDARDGSMYASDTLVGKTYHNFTLSSQALTDLTSSLSSNVFGVGIDTNHTGDLGVGSKDHSTSAKRPVLTLVYGVNHSDAGSAITEGIQNALGDIEIFNDQQVYFVNEDDTHYLGTFDRVTQYENKTWAFNYVLPAELFTNIPSLPQLWNVWENQSLLDWEIRDQVETFINGGISP